MAEMSRGSREESWAPQIEKALQGLVERHPLGFPVSITCRAAICQITDIGPVTDVLKNEAQYNAYWGNFEQKLQSAPSSAEFATTSYFTAQAPEDPSQNISGYVLTTIDRVAPRSRRIARDSSREAAGSSDEERWECAVFQEALEGSNLTT